MGINFHFSVRFAGEVIEKNTNQKIDNDLIGFKFKKLCLQ